MDEWRDPALVARLERDHVVWLTTVTDAGGPFPTPVWFVPDEAGIVLYTGAESRKVRNVRARPLVSLHFNSDPHGEDVVVVRGRASVDLDARPSAHRTFMEKYERAVAAWGLTPEELDKITGARITVQPLGLWFGPEA